MVRLVARKRKPASIAMRRNTQGAQTEAGGRNARDTAVGAANRGRMVRTKPVTGEPVRKVGHTTSLHVVQHCVDHGGNLGQGAIDKFPGRVRILLGNFTFPLRCIFFRRWVCCRAVWCLRHPGRPNASPAAAHAPTRRIKSRRVTCLSFNREKILTWRDRGNGSRMHHPWAQATHPTLLDTNLP